MKPSSPARIRAANMIAPHIGRTGHRDPEKTARRRSSVVAEQAHDERIDHPQA